jgi:DNA repair protein RadC
MKLYEQSTICNLLANLMGGRNSEQKAKMLLDHYNHDLKKIFRLSIHELRQFLSETQSRKLMYSFALSLAKNLQVNETYLQIRTSKDSYKILKPYFEGLLTEHFFIICMNRRNAVLKIVKISEGGTAGALVDAKVVYKVALLNNASSLILAHNHPSGNLYPSMPDKQITQELKIAGNQLTISVLDHLIVTDGGYYSFADSGEL